jgi:hypothetical protein
MDTDQPGGGEQEDRPDGGQPDTRGDRVFGAEQDGGNPPDTAPSPEPGDHHSRDWRSGGEAGDRAGGRDSRPGGGYREDRERRSQGGYREDRDRRSDGGYRGDRDRGSGGGSGYRAGERDSRPGGGYREDRERRSQGGYRGDRDRGSGGGPGYDRGDRTGRFEPGQRDRGDQSDHRDGRQSRRPGPEDREALREGNRQREANRMRNKNRIDSREVPLLPDHVSVEDLPSYIRAQLRGLGEQNGELVGRHLAMVLEYLEEVPEMAYRHARAAADRAGRVAVVREFSGLTSYYTDRWAEAVRELRTYQRLTGEWHYAALLADALRGAGKPAEALEYGARVPSAGLDPDEAIELGIVLAGARGDLGEFRAAKVALDRLGRNQLEAEQRARVQLARQRIEALEQGASPETQEFVEQP